MSLPDGTVPKLPDALIRRAIHTARKNWDCWRDVFEHGSPINTNPLLESELRFRAFLKEYSVGRTIQRSTHEAFRAELRDKALFSDAVGEDSGRSLGELEVEMRKRFGTREGARSLISALSKIAAFVRPERFVAWDQYARRGINTLLDRKPSSRFATYADYLGAFDQAWNGEAGQDIKEYLAKAGAQEAKAQERFLRRVLDVCAMRIGGLAERGENRRASSSGSKPAASAS